MPRYITGNLEVSYGKENSDEENYSEKNSD